MIKSLLPVLMIFVFFVCFNNASAQKKRDNSGYGENLITVSPLTITDYGLAVGACFEHKLDEKGLLYLSLPLFYTFSDFDTYNGTSEASVIGFYPGVKIYPTTPFGVVKYGVGPSLVFSYGKDNYSTNYYGYQGYDANRIMVGMMVNNSININIATRYYFGAELGMGVSYLNKREGYSDGTMLLGKMGFSFGYRF